MLDTIIEKGDSMQNQMDNFSWEVETIRKNQMEIPEIKNTVTEINTSFRRLISRLNWGEELIHVLKVKSIKINQVEL